MDSCFCPCKAFPGVFVVAIADAQAFGLMMSLQRLPLIGSSPDKTTAKPPHSSTLQRPPKAGRRKRAQQQPASALVLDATMTPWEGLALASSFTSIPPPPPLPQPPPPPPPPAPQPTPARPCSRTLNGDGSGSSPDSPAPSPPVLQAGGGDRGLRARRRVLPQCWVPRPPRPPPLRPVTNLSFTRSFTFSYFALPRHQSPHCRAERLRNLTLLLKQTRY